MPSAFHRYPNSWMVYGKSEHQMDENSVCPVVRKPPYYTQIILPNKVFGSRIACALTLAWTNPTDVPKLTTNHIFSLCFIFMLPRA
jgi:hypothetical protein